MHIDFNSVNGLPLLSSSDFNTTLQVGLTFKQKDYNNSDYSTYVVLYVDKINQNIIISKIIDEHGNFCLHHHSFTVCEIPYFLFSHKIQYSSKFDNRTRFDFNKEDYLQKFFAVSYVKNEVHANLTTQFIQFVINVPFKFKTSPSKKYVYPKDYPYSPLYKVDCVKYELVYHKQYQFFWQLSKLAQFQ